MRFVDFIEVQMRPIEAEGKVQVVEMPRIIEANHVTGFAPGAIPSGLSGPGGQMIMKPAAYICLAGERVLVTCSVEEAMYKIRWENVEVELPEIKGKTIGLTDSVITRTVKRPKLEEEKKSSIIN